MASYYLDIETYGKSDNAYDNEIITIQYQKLWQETGKPIEDLVILKSWNTSEEEIIKKFFEKFRIHDTWNFIPVGYRLWYEFIVISKRSKKYGFDIKTEDFLLHPHIDIHPILVIMNKGSFKGARLDTFTQKEGRGTDVLTMYEKRDFTKILHYIKQEAQEFLKFYQWLLTTLPNHYKDNYQKQ
ncbi:MAG: ribonuclease H-like domain-containing protein [Candidatus Heimdallarchaeaceae archaeon]